MELKFSKEIPMPKGLKNLGNTCFFNSVMQNLANSRLLRLHLCSLEGTFSGKRLTNAFLEFLVNMHTKSGQPSYSPSRLFQEVCNKAPRFKGFQQQDSHELLHYLLDGVNDEELIRTKNAKAKLSEKNDTFVQDSSQADAAKSDSNKVSNISNNSETSTTETKHELENKTDMEQAANTENSTKTSPNVEPVIIGGIVL